MGSCNNSTQPFSKTICSICYEDLKPIVEDLQAISLCGHVFHELCIQQWFEYCSKGKKKCPICKQKCSASNVSRLYFQSVGDSDDHNISSKPQTRQEEFPEELKLEVRKLEAKNRGLSLALQSRESDLKNVIEEFSVCKEQLKTETLLKNEAMEQTRTFECLLNLKTQELKKSELERNNLHDRNMALAKENAALKLVYDLNLEKDKIVKLLKFCNESCSEKNMDPVAELWADRTKSYKELMTKYNDLARDEARSCRELKSLKEKVEKMETAKEMKPKASKKKKDSFNDTCAPQDTIKEPEVSFRKTKRLRETEDNNNNNIKSNNKDGDSVYISSDDDIPNVSKSPKYQSYDSVPQFTKSAIIDDDVAFIGDIGQYKIFPNITNEASLPVRGSQGAEICFSAGVLAPDGTKRHLGSWCKKGQKNGSKQSSGDLIAVGADGRGGTTKVLKSLNCPSNDSRGSLFSVKNSKFGSKTSGFHSTGHLQIDHFFSKTDH